MHPQEDRRLASLFAPVTNSHTFVALLISHLNVTFQDCREEVEHSEPQIRKALDCANALLDDDDLDKSEKEQIRRYIASLEIDLKAIRKQAKEEEDRLVFLLAYFYCACLEFC